MNVLLVHPIHGAKMAMCDAEIEHDEKLGWTRYTEPEVEADKPKRVRTRRTTEEQPISNALVSEDS